MIADLEHWRLMERDLHTRWRDLRTNVASGLTPEAYMRTVGEIDGLKFVLALSRQVYSQLSGQPAPSTPEEPDDDDFPI